MPKFMTYQRPAAVNRQNWGGRPGVAYGTAAKPAPKPAPVPRNPVLDIRLPGLTQPKAQ